MLDELARPQIAVNPVTSELLVAWSMEDIIGTPAVEAGTVAHRASPTGAPIGDEIVVDLEAYAFAGFDGDVAADPLTGNWLVYAGTSPTVRGRSRPNPVDCGPVDRPCFELFAAVSLVGTAGGR